MSNDFLDFNDVDIKPKFKEKYKAVKDEKHRISIIWPQAEGGPFVMADTHYFDKYILCKGGVCCEKEPAKTRLACLVVKYKTKKDGTFAPVAAGEALPFDYEIMEWVFTEAKFNQLKTLHNEWNLKEHDLLVELKGDEKFQNLIFTPCKDSAWQAQEPFKQVIYKESEVIRPNLKSALGADLTTDEIKELLGLGVASPQDVVSSESELTDILQEV
jgi:hypothetical protein